jgi:hypothetical protein
MSMKLKLSPNFSLGLVAVLFSFAINAATQEADPSRIVASIYDGALKTHGAVGAPVACGWIHGTDRQRCLKL